MWVANIWRGRSTGIWFVNSIGLTWFHPFVLWFQTPVPYWHCQMVPSLLAAQGMHPCHAPECALYQHYDIMTQDQNIINYTRTIIWLCLITNTSGEDLAAFHHFLFCVMIAWNILRIKHKFYALPFKIRWNFMQLNIWFSRLVAYATIYFWCLQVGSRHHRLQFVYKTLQRPPADEVKDI